MKTIEGMLTAKGLKLAIVVSRFNEFITSKLLGGAEDAIRRTGGNTDEVVLVWVPGAYEIPLAAQKLAGCPGLTRFPWLRRSWRKVESLMQ